MWSATKISADAANNMQIQAGLLLNSFNIADPKEPADSAIICATTGDFNITCVPETSDFFEDVNNAPNNTKEGKHITGWNCGLTVGCLEITEDTLILSLGAADVGADGGVHPRHDYKVTDFKKLYWIGDMMDEDNLLCVVMDDTVNTGGLSLTTTKNGKGNLSLSLTPHASAATPKVIPMGFYLLEKVDGSATAPTYTAVSPVGTENPSEEGWYVLSGDRYVLTNDTAVDSNKTYYEIDED